MELRWLETFVVVAREGSLASAASELGYARSTVTHHLQSLEKSLGTKLFDRHNTDSPLTRTGEAFLAHAESALKHLDLGREQVARAEGHEQEFLRLGATESVCAYRLPLLLRLLHRHLPDSRIDVGVASASTIAEQLERGALDIGLTSRAWRRDTATSRTLWDEKPQLIRSAQARGVGSTVLVTEPGCVYREIVDAEYLPEAPGARKVQIGSLEAVKAGVLSGMGIGLVPLIAAQPALNSGELVTLPWQPRRRVVTEVAWNSETCSATVQEFLRRIHAEPAAERRARPSRLISGPGSATSRQRAVVPAR